MSPFARTVYLQKYSMNGNEEWSDTAHRVATHVLGALGYSPFSDEVNTAWKYIAERKFMPGGRYLYASGRDLHQVNNCLLMDVEDSREGWTDLWSKAGSALMTGAGIGVDYSKLREEGAPVNRTGGQASGPLSLMYSINEIGRQVMQGGSRRSAIWAGLSWKHPDVKKFIRYKDWAPELRALKEKDFNFPLAMELTNISVQLDDEFFEAYGDVTHPLNEWAHEVYWMNLRRMLKTAEPGFSVDVGENAGETLRNACTEVTSADDSDVCNLGSINLARVSNIEELKSVVEIATLFLTAGTVYSHVPYDKVKDVRAKNRRLGLGVMGIHEWLLQRSKKYGPDTELAQWLKVYATSTEVAGGWAGEHSLSRSVKTRAIAPTGTIGIIAETTTGIEPILAAAFKRRYLAGSEWRYQYVIDPTAKRIVDEHGTSPEGIEDAYQLAYDVERRVEFQAWVQKFVDHGISSTINLPHPIIEDDQIEDFGNMLLGYLPELRGITCYPNGARGGQPLEAVSYEYASRQEGLVFEESEDRCIGGACGV